MATVIIGADVGQRVDPTAVCVAKLERRATTETVAAGLLHGAPLLETKTVNVDHYTVRYLERLPLGTAYPDVAERLKAICAGAKARSGETPTLYVDATGVGTPLVDMLGRAGVPARIRGCYFNHGDKRTEEGYEVKIGKAWLVGHLQVLLQSGRLHLPKTGEAEALAQELLDYEIKIDENGTDRYGAFKVGRHDDLVTALGLAVQPVRIPWGIAG